MRNYNICAFAFGSMPAWLLPPQFVPKGQLFADFQQEQRGVQFRVLPVPVGWSRGSFVPLLELD